MSSGTGIRGRGERPIATAIASIIPPYEVTSGPPISTSRPAVAGISSDRRRYSITSAIAIGWVRVATQRGVTIAGSRLTR